LAVDDDGEDEGLIKKGLKEDVGWGSLYRRGLVLKEGSKGNELAGGGGADKFSCLKVN
jgi:hypothetical protein